MRHAYPQHISAVIERVLAQARRAMRARDNASGGAKPLPATKGGADA